MEEGRREAYHERWYTKVNREVGTVRTGKFTISLKMFNQSIFSQM